MLKLRVAQVGVFVAIVVGITLGFLLLLLLFGDEPEAPIWPLLVFGFGGAALLGVPMFVVEERVRSRLRDRRLSAVRDALAQKGVAPAASTDDWPGPGGQELLPRQGPVDELIRWMTYPAGYRDRHHIWSMSLGGRRVELVEDLVEHQINTGRGTVSLWKVFLVTSAAVDVSGELRVAPSNRVRESVSAAVQRRLGHDPLHVGDHGFDRRISLKGDAALASRLLDPHTRSWWLDHLGGVSVAIAHGRLLAMVETKQHPPRAAHDARRLVKAFQGLLNRVDSLVER
ncbi:MAG TPA: hypothetical protein VM287_07850 [Egibacteraceae bacterium]|nr:hypothetical protein [Egibacteraceae bacterium]